MCLSTDEGLSVTCTQKKWDKGKTIILKWLEKLEQGDTQVLEHKSLEKDMGFLVHLSRTFPGMAPYLKGFYNTMNSWRMGRDEDGWKLSMSEWKTFLAMDESITEAFREQEQIGWQHLFLGQLSMKWKYAQYQYLLQQASLSDEPLPKSKSAQTWATNLCKRLMHPALNRWQIRNEAYHDSASKFGHVRE